VFFCYELVIFLKFCYCFGADLFEVVDRRAKLVARDSADEQSGIQPPGIATLLFIVHSGSFSEGLWDGVEGTRNEAIL